MNKSQTKIGAVISFLTIITGNAIALFYTPFMLSCLGQAEYGTYSVVNSIVSYLMVFDLGFATAIVRYGSQYKEQGDKEKESGLYGNFVLIYSVVGIIVFVIGIYLAFHLTLFECKFSASELKTAKLLMILGVSNIAVSFPLGIFRAIITINENYLFLKGLDFFRTILTPAFIVLLLLSGYKSIALMGVTVFINICTMLIHLIYSFMAFRIKPKFVRFEKRLLREIFSYSFLVFLGMVVDKIYWSTDQIILAAINGPNEVAVYSIGVLFPSYLIAFSLAISNVLLPKITKIVSGDINDSAKDKILTDLFVRIGRIQFWLLSLILSGFIWFGRSFINIWVGPEYDISYYIAIIIMIPSIVPLTQNTGIFILQAKKMITFRTVVNIVVAAVNLAISIPLAYLWGSVGCAVGTSFGTVAGTICCLNIYYYKKANIDIPLYWNNFLRMMPCLIIPGIYGFFIRNVWSLNSFLSLGAAILIYIIIFILSAYLLGMNTYEKQQFALLLNRFNGKYRKPV